MARVCVAHHKCVDVVCECDWRLATKLHAFDDPDRTSYAFLVGQVVWLVEVVGFFFFLIIGMLD